MLSMGREVRGYVIYHIIDYIISWGSYQKSMQTTFLKELIIILKRRRSYAKGRYKSKKVDNFSLSQKVGLICR